MIQKKAIAVISGGMDSTCAATLAIQEGYDVIALHFNYGQRTEKRELKAFHDVCDALTLTKKYVFDLPFFPQIGASALLDTNLEIPIGGIEAGVPITYVPFRNGIFLSIAGALAEKEEASTLIIGAVEEDSSGYPDCREEFLTSFTQTLTWGTKEGFSPTIWRPLVHLKKEEIVALAVQINAPLHATWSCYKNEEKACGVCDSCRLRLKGFYYAGINDPIIYEEKR